jgi:hypothetical protein
MKKKNLILRSRLAGGLLLGGFIIVASGCARPVIRPDGGDEWLTFQVGDDGKHHCYYNLEEVPCYNNGWMVTFEEMRRIVN